MSLNWSLLCSYLIRLCDSSLYDLHILFTDEATSRQVVQDALDAPQPGHQQLSVVGEDIKTRQLGIFSLTHVYCPVSSVG